MSRRSRLIREFVALVVDFLGGILEKAEDR